MLLQNLGHQILQLFILIKVGMLEAVAFVVICTDLFPVYPGVAVLLRNLSVSNASYLS